MNDLTTVANKPPQLVWREMLEQRKNEIKNMLPSDISPDVFIRAATTATQLNPEILACTWQSRWDACVRACRAGLLPDGQEAAIVPFKNRAQFVPMVQGVLRNIRRSGQLKWIQADVVREGEIFIREVTHDGPVFRHVPGNNFQAPIIGAYAVAGTKDGGFFNKYLSLDEINKHRAFSRAGREDSPWNQWFEAMAIKTAIHGLGKTLPSVRDALSEDETIVDVPTLRITPATKSAAQSSAEIYPDDVSDGEARSEEKNVTQAPDQKKKPQPESANPG
jgi:recombination protein RecT